MLISEKDRMVSGDIPFFSCYVNEIPLSSLYKKIIREILGTDYTPYMWIIQT